MLALSAMVQSDSESSPLLLAALIPGLVLLLAFMIFCLVSVVRHPARHLPKWAWALICVASVPLGGILYLILGRDVDRS